jgi:branched-chain amino acid transport system substrate-binding protein
MLAARRTYTAVALGLLIGLTAASCSSSSKPATSSGTNATSVAGGSNPTAAKWPVPAGGNGGATAPGVTATSINLGVMTSVSGPLPGATQNAQRGAAAYYAYINSLGGVYGRMLQATQGDDGFDPTKAQAACARLIPSTFAIVGSEAAADSGCFDQVKSSGIPWIGGYLDPQYYSIPNAIYPGASSAVQVSTNPFVIWKKEHPDVVKMAVLWENVPGIQALADASASGLDQSGFQVVYNQSFSATNPNLASYVIQMRNKGVQGVYLYGVDVTAGARFATAMAQQDFNPALKSDYAVYDARWHSLAGSAAAGWETNINSLPFLSDSSLNSNPGGALFLQWFHKVYPGVQLDTFAIIGWQSAMYFVQGLVAAGAQPTRANVLAALHQIHSYNAMGLIGPTDPGDKKLSTCSIEMTATSSGYQQTYPATPNQFECSLGTIINVGG